ncbi:MAG: hypothetical protein ACE5PM_01070 [Candidatus Hydrothermarchaeales archaeon]
MDEACERPMHIVFMADKSDGKLESYLLIPIDGVGFVVIEETIPIRKGIGDTGRGFKAIKFRG